MKKTQDPLHDFVIECRQLLEHVEEALMRIELAPEEPETLDAIADATRAIKRAAGLFDFGRLIGSTAGAGIERVQSAELRIYSQMMALQAAVCDHLGRLAKRVAAVPLPDNRRA